MAVASTEGQSREHPRLHRGHSIVREFLGAINLARRPKIYSGVKNQKAGALKRNELGRVHRRGPGLARKRPRQTGFRDREPQSGSIRFKRKALPITDTELKAMATLASMGLSNTGTPRA